MTAQGSRKIPRVALIAIGLGRVQRGFERYFTDLFEVLRNELDVVLFKSCGASGPSERTPAFLQQATAVARKLPLGRFAGTREYNRDCMAFALTLLPELLQNRFDVVHCIDPPLAHALVKLKRMFHFRAALLFTEGCAMPVHFYPGVEHIHHVASEPFEVALRAGISASRMTLIPCGIHSERFSCTGSRSQLREKYCIPEKTFVVVAISALKREHKRVDHIIEEVSRLPEDVLLWLDGNPEDATVTDLAAKRLGARCRITHVPSPDVAELYRASDVLVHASLSEAFGLVLVEAASAGIPVLAHNALHFDWLLQDPNCLVDMATPGCLSERLIVMLRSRREGREIAQARSAVVKARFDWTQLKPAYVDMYDRLLHRPTSYGAAFAGRDS